MESPWAILSRLQIHGRFCPTNHSTFKLLWLAVQAAQAAQFPTPTQLNLLTPAVDPLSTACYLFHPPHPLHWYYCRSIRGTLYSKMEDKDNLRPRQVVPVQHFTFTKTKRPMAYCWRERIPYNAIVLCLQRGHWNHSTFSNHSCKTTLTPLVTAKHVAVTIIEHIYQSLPSSPTIHYTCDETLKGLRCCEILESIQTYSILWCET